MYTHVFVLDLGRLWERNGLVHRHRVLDAHLVVRQEF